MASARSLTIRISEQLWLDIARAAQGREVPINVVINELLRQGLDKHADASALLKTFLIQHQKVEL